MSADRLRRYRFSTEAQWQACLVAQADRVTSPGGAAIQPFAPYQRQATLYDSHGAHAPVLTRAGEMLWRDDDGGLHRLQAGDRSMTTPAPSAIARATRLVVTTDGLWAIGEARNSLERFDEQSLTRVLAAEVTDARIIDIASDGRHAVFVLVTHAGEWRTIRYDRAGHSAGAVRFEGIPEPKAFVFLRRSQRFVVLAGGRHSRLYWFEANGGDPLFSIPVAALHPCFGVTALGSDARDRILLAGADGADFGSAPSVLILDGDGNLLGDVPLDPSDAPASGVAASHDRLLVTGPRGLLQFDVAAVVPDEAGLVRAVLVTPVLFSPDREDQRRWLRVDASASLPEGSTLDITFAATDDVASRDRLEALAADRSMTESQRINRLLAEPGLWRPPTSYQGSELRARGEGPPSSARLFDVRERYLWVSITLTAAAGARLPRLTELSILYPGRTLMEHLPSIYQSEEARPDSFLRSLVGVLEATTQSIDARIAAMGRHVHPASAQGSWLDFIARWTGVPWDDALDVEQKRRIVMRAGVLGEQRGTRAGLEALLECLMPGVPRRFRVTDATADFGFAMVGGDNCPGSTLPAMLGGHTRWSAELGSRSVLGFMRLPCPGQEDDGASRLTGRLIVEVAASAKERQAWEPWLRALITQMVPLTARLELRWVSAHALRSHRLDGTMALKGPPAPHLGTDAITNLARLPARGVRLSKSGPGLSRPLR